MALNVGSTGREVMRMAGEGNGVSKCRKIGNHDIFEEEQEITHLDLRMQSGQKSDGKANIRL